MSNRQLRMANPDVIDQAVGTGMQIYDSIWALPSAVFEKSVSAALQGKDAVKRKLFKNPWGSDSDEDINAELMSAASSSRNKDELARLYKWAVAKRDAKLKSAVTARCRQIGINVSDLGATSWAFNPTDRAYRYRANNAIEGEQICGFCGETQGLIEVGHIDGHEEHNEPENLIWTCRPCNVVAANTMRKAGLGRPTRQYNPGGAKTVGEWAQAVGAITPHKGRKYAGRNYGLVSSMPVSEAVAIIRATPAAARSRFARELAKHKSSRRRSNPGDDSAAEFYEKFHGRESEEEIIIETEVHEHDKLGVVGILVACTIDTPTGLRATIRFESEGSDQVPWLCGTVKEIDGRKVTQLYIEGGCQHVDLAELEMDGDEWLKERMILGTFAPPGDRPGGKPEKWNLSYLTQKSFDKFEDIEYQHDLGEPDEDEPKSHRREPPTLEYDPRNELLYIVGGQYKIKLPMFGVSPGIEN